jgi:hypothetical protein
VIVRSVALGQASDLQSLRAAEKQEPPTRMIRGSAGRARVDYLLGFRLHVAGNLPY